MRIPWLVIGVVALAACGGCGSEDADSEVSTQASDPGSVPTTELVAAPETTEIVEEATTTAPPGPPRHQVWGKVTKHEERGTILCLGAQRGGGGGPVDCGEPTYDVVGLDWDALTPPLPEGIANASLLLTGTLEDGRLVLTEQPDPHGGWWIDRDSMGGGSEGHLTDDPTEMVLNLRFTGDLARHEAELR